MRKHGIIISAITVALLSTAAFPSGAQDDDEFDEQESEGFACMGFNWPCSGNSLGHYLFENPNPFLHTRVQSGHTDCRICYVVNKEQIPWDTLWNTGIGCHGSCNPPEPAYEDALAAARDFDADKLIALASRVRGRITYNAARRSIQLLDCQSKGVVANVTVPDRLLSVASTLPDVRASFRAIGLATDRRRSAGNSEPTMPGFLMLGLLGFLATTVARRRRR